MKRIILSLIILMLLPQPLMAKEDVLKEKGKSIDQIKMEDHVKIVGLGESTHGNSRLQSLRWDIFKELIDQGYCHFGLEALYEDGKLIDDYIHGRIELSNIEVAGKTSFFLYNTQEMADLFKHLRDYNKSHKEKVSFFGFDMQSFEKPLSIFLDSFKKYDSETVESLRTMMAENDFDDKEKRQILASLKMSLKKKENEILKREGKATFDELEYILTILDQYLVTMKDSKMDSKRDYYMAKNIQWYQQHHSGKVFVCGHNGHILKNFPNRKTMGHYLKDVYGKEYYSIGTAVYDNEFYSKEVTVLGKFKDLKKFKLKNINPLLVEFKKTNMKEALYQFEDMNEEESKVFQEELLFPEIGAGYNPVFSSLYQAKYDPWKSEDGLILLLSDNAYHFLGYK